MKSWIPAYDMQGFGLGQAAEDRNCFWRAAVFDECGGADLNGDGRVTGEDMRELAYHWLAGFE